MRRSFFPAAAMAMAMFGLIGGALCVSYAQTPPSNDRFANRILLTGNQLSVTGSNVMATKEVGEPSHAGNEGGKSVWWTWTASADGWLTVTTAGSLESPGTPLDTILGIYTGAQVTNLQSVASGDDSANATSRALCRVRAGVSYSIAVDGYKSTRLPVSAEGAIRLNLSYAAEFVASAWRLPDVNSKMVNSTDFAGELVLLNFWATWSPPSVRMIAELADLQRLYGESGLSVIGVSIDSSEGEGPPVTLIRQFVSEYQVNYPVVMSRPSGALEDAYGGIETLPVTYIIDRQNRVVDYLSGFQTRGAIERVVLPQLISLRARRSAQGVDISWPALGYFVTFETATRLAPSDWTPLDATIRHDGSRDFVLLPLGKGMRFFRLKAE